MFGDDCISWQGEAVDNDDVPASCQLMPTDRAAAQRLLNNTAIIFIGDSTGRKAALQLIADLEGKRFVDAVNEVGAALHDSTNIIQPVSDESNGFNGYIASYWFPRVVELKDALASPDWSNEHLARPEWNNGVRKVVIVHYSAWDLHKYWKDVQQKNIPAWMGDLTDVFASIKEQNGIDSFRDVLLYRLPVPIVQPKLIASMLRSAQAPLNPESVAGAVQLAADMLVDLMSIDHPDVGLIDAFSWTTADADGDNAHKCSPVDARGTYFGTDVARTVYLQQVLHGIKVYGCGKDSWGDALARDLSTPGIGMW